MVISYPSSSNVSWTHVIGSTSFSRTPRDFHVHRPRSPTVDRARRSNDDRASRARVDTLFVRRSIVAFDRSFVERRLSSSCASFFPCASARSTNDTTVIPTHANEDSRSVERAISWIARDGRRDAFAIDERERERERERKRDRRREGRTRGTNVRRSAALRRYTQTQRA